MARAAARTSHVRLGDRDTHTMMFFRFKSTCGCVAAHWDCQCKQSRQCHHHVKQCYRVGDSETGPAGSAPKKSTDPLLVRLAFDETSTVFSKTALSPQTSRHICLFLQVFS